MLGKENEGRSSIIMGTISSHQKISVTHSTGCTALYECTGNLNPAFYFIGISYFMLPQYYQGSTPATTQSHRGGNAIGEAWEGAPSYQQDSQRPAL